MAVIDLNSDLGENTPQRPVGDDESMLALVTSANVSCGAHAGSPEGIARTLSAAVRRGVAIGAHPSYPDYEGFGRRPQTLSSAALQAEVEQQIGRLIDWARAAGGDVSYVKPHGALYNAIVHDERQARDVVAAVRAIDPDLVLLGLAGGAVLRVAERSGVAVAAEAFADRAYRPDGQLVSRTETGAVLTDPVLVAERMLQLAQTGTVRAIDGTELVLAAQSICVHGDSPDAVAMADAVRHALQQAQVDIVAFAGPQKR